MRKFFAVALVVMALLVGGLYSARAIDNQAGIIAGSKTAENIAETWKFTCNKCGHVFLGNSSALKKCPACDHYGARKEKID